MPEYKRIYQGGQSKTVVKKSRFIASSAAVSSEEEALSFIESVKKNYWDASHNCYAYVIGEYQELKRYSDDGEPSGTAGKPILDILLRQELYDAVLVVTRYFGGTLLGAGGLLRAYSNAAKEGLASSVIITRISGVKLKIAAEYSDLGTIQYILRRQGLNIADTKYTDKVAVTVFVPDELLKEVKGKLTEQTDGRALSEEAGHCFYADVGGRTIILS